MNIEQIAAICHEVNRVICEADNDFSQNPWEETPGWARDSAIKGVIYALENPNATPEDQHIAWMSDKYRDGWQYGEIKDPDLKLHPCLVPYDQLPTMQRLKDKTFKAICNACRVAG